MLTVDSISMLSDSSSPKGVEAIEHTCKVSCLIVVAVILTYAADTQEGSHKLGQGGIEGVTACCSHISRNNAVKQDAAVHRDSKQAPH